MKKELFLIIKAAIGLTIFFGFFYVIIYAVQHLDQVIYGLQTDQLFLLIPIMCFIVVYEFIRIRNKKHLKNHPQTIQNKQEAIVDQVSNDPIPTKSAEEYSEEESYIVDYDGRDIDELEILAYHRLGEDKVKSIIQDVVDEEVKLIKKETLVQLLVDIKMQDLHGDPE